MSGAALEDTIAESFANFEQADESQQIFSIERNYDSWESYVDKVEDTVNPNVVDSMKQQLRFLRNGIQQHKEGLFASNPQLAGAFVSVAEGLQEKIVELIADHGRYQSSRTGRSELPPNTSAARAAVFKQITADVEAKIKHTDAYNSMLEASNYTAGDPYGELAYARARKAVNDERIALFQSTRSPDAIDTIRQLEKRGFVLSNQIDDLQNKVHGGTRGAPSRSPSQLRLRGGAPSQSRSQSREALDLTGQTSSSQERSSSEESATDSSYQLSEQEQNKKMLIDFFTDPDSGFSDLVKNYALNRLIAVGWNPSLASLTGASVKQISQVLSDINAAMVKSKDDHSTSMFTDMNDLIATTEYAFENNVSLKDAKKAYKKETRRLMRPRRTLHETYDEIPQLPPIREEQGPTTNQNALAAVTRQLEKQGTLGSMYTNDNEGEIWKKFGVRAKTMRQAFHRGYTRINPKASLFNVIQFLANYGISLDKPLPGAIQTERQGFYVSAKDTERTPTRRTTTLRQKLFGGELINTPPGMQYSDWVEYKGLGIKTRTKCFKAL